ncbi:MAG: alpha-amylase family glycosyl hydrolase [Balneolaceae bacterium]|nr:alpha-amylase family glycosyl hydrolase [Balneolaceae bacterium]
MISTKLPGTRTSIGCTLSDDSTSFAFYCPRAQSVRCIIFDHSDDEKGKEYQMQKSKTGIWMLTIEQNLEGKWYGYKADFKKSDQPKTPYTNELFADPYSKHVTVRNTYQQDAKTYIFDGDFNWEDTGHCFPDDIRDLIIYETHIKDLTAHPSSGAKGMGSFKKLIDPNQTGGIQHLKKLGVNCVEFLPLQKFAPVEPPYGTKTKEGFHNSWNPYEANYWGYMTSFFFAPESTFASDWSNRHSGRTTAAVTEFKEAIKSLHSEGITVLMDVVYNHTSLFDKNPHTHLVPDVYLRKDHNGNLMNRSGTGNEFKSEEPAARQLIIDSLLYWMEEYKIDGFRFDLAALLDNKTWDVIKKAVHEKYPNAVLIAEPWGGHYSPHKFSDYGWASWNDRIRNSFKGSDPQHDRGFIFSDWQHETKRERLENILQGTLNHDEGGLYQTSAHSVNYLESHDGYTLGDFIRIGLNPEIHDQTIENLEDHTKLNEQQLTISKLAALSLFVTQGITMIHAGQEFARSKVIARTPVKDPDEGKIDHNSYQKDNETNWLNFNHLKLNRELFDYYRGLIDIRKKSPALRKCQAEEIDFDYYGNPLLLSFYISGNSTGDMYDYYVLLNGNSYPIENQELPPGVWEILADHEIASSHILNVVSESVKIPSQSGILLRKLRH